jgi:hypothetical protein
MKFRTNSLLTLTVCGLLGFTTFISHGQEHKSDAVFSPVIPKTWDDAAIASLEVPVVVPKYSPKPVSADYYYKIPARTIYKSYPIYAPGRAPVGYLEKLKTLEPEVAFDPTRLKTEQDWVRAGELVFEAPTLYDGELTLENVADPNWYTHTRVRLTRDGIMPYARYVLRKKGKLEVGNLSCAMCHTSVLEDGTVIKAGQGNFPLDRNNALVTRRSTVEEGRRDFLALFSIPWIPERQQQLESYSLEEMAAIFDSIPLGVLARNRSSPFFPPAIPDLHRVRDRRYLDKSGLNQHRGMVDLMRYAAMAQGLEFLSSFDGFIPLGEENFTKLPPPESQGRFSDEQLYALALWLYSLEPPPNPRPPEVRLVVAGKKVFDQEGCGACHTPPLYTNNKLTPAKEFKVPEEHKSRYDVLPVSVGTDPRLTMETRRGTGYYKVPSLRGLWYRGPFEHNGSVATLEDWFDPTRLRDDYVPTGFVGHGVKTRAVKGHEFGLGLSTDDKKALIAFLKTL